MRVFLDANILFSAARSSGAINQLVHRLAQSGHACCVDSYVIEEARRNLAIKAPEQLSEFEHLLRRMEQATAMHGGDDELEASLPLPAEDRPVLAAAIRRQCDALVTGDRTHFGALYGHTVHGVAIHSPRSLAEALLS
jgi:predicted nucleic acid-binding protein